MACQEPLRLSSQGGEAEAAQPKCDRQRTIICQQSMGCPLSPADQHAGLIAGQVIATAHLSKIKSFSPLKSSLHFQYDCTVV